MAEDYLDLRPLISKLDHHLIEVRERALHNILSKLENGIITYECLVNHKDLFINLMQCLRKKEFYCDSAIINLLVALSQYSSAAETLRQLHAVDFFTTLRQEVNSSQLLEQIEKILENLFMYHGELEQHVEEKTNDLNAANNVTNIAQEYFYETQAVCDDILERYNEMKDEEQVKAMPSFQAPSFYGKSVEYSKEKFTTAVPCSASDFDWIPLTSGDRHILAVTESRLQSRSSSLIIQSCNFFVEILLQDFPPEIFIQRPTIVQTMLSTIPLFQSTDTSLVHLVLKCILELSNKIQKRLHQKNDVDFESPFQEGKTSRNSSALSSAHTESSSLQSKTSSINPTSAVHVSVAIQAQLDGTYTDSLGRDTSGESSIQNAGIDEYESEVLRQALQQSQLSIAQYCLSVISSTANLLQLYLQEPELFSVIVQLHECLIELLKVDDLREIWTDDNNQSKKTQNACVLHHF